MRSRPLFFGSLVALITPFTPSRRVDKKALEALIEWQIEQGTDGIVCCGTTGEGLSLSQSERKKVIEICVAVSNGRIPIIAGTGTCDTRQTIRFTEDALKKGASGCLVVTPYYNKPTQRGCVEHFCEVAKVGLPMIVYHNPGRTLFRFTVDSVQQLGEVPGIVAMKDSTHDLEFIRSVRKVTLLPILSGEDDLTVEIMEEGGVGAISVIGNVIPGSWRRMIHAALAKDMKLAKKLAAYFLPLCKGFFLETNPQCVKYVLSQLKRCEPIFRLPLNLPSQETQQTLNQILLRTSLAQFTPYPILRTV